MLNAGSTSHWEWAVGLCFFLWPVPECHKCGLALDSAQGQQVEWHYHNPNEALNPKRSAGVAIHVCFPCLRKYRACIYCFTLAERMDAILKQQGY